MLQVLKTMSQTLTLAEERLSPTSKSSDYFAVDIKSMEPEISAMSSELDSEVFSGLAKILKKVVEDRERMRENQIEIIRKSVKVAAEDFLKSVKPPSFPETVAQKINSLKQKHGPMPSMKDSVNSLETLCKDLFGKFESVLIEKAIESANPPQDTQGDSSNLNSNAFPALLSSNPDMVSEVPRKRVENIGALPEMVGKNPQLQSTSKKLPPQLQHLLNLKHVEKAFNLAATEYSDEEALDQLCREVVPDRSGANSKLESTLKEFVIWFSSHNNYSD